MYEETVGDKYFTATQRLYWLRCTNNVIYALVSVIIPVWLLKFSRASFALGPCCILKTKEKRIFNEMIFRYI